MTMNTLSQTEGDVMREIITAMSPWTLACAVGAENGTIGIGMGFDYWLRRSRENWMPQVKAKTGAPETTIILALVAFVAENKLKDYQTVLRQEEAIRGVAPSVVLGPGESMTVTAQLGPNNDAAGDRPGGATDAPLS